MPKQQASNAGNAANRQPASNAGNATNRQPASNASNSANAQPASNSTNAQTTTTPKSQYQYIKEGWGSWPNFMMSYGLKRWEDEDVQMGKRIIASFMEADEEDRAAEAAEAAESNSGGKKR